MEKSQIKVLEKISFYDFISTVLKGISQVILIENAISGLLILIAISIGDYRLGIMALLSAIIGTLVGYAAGADKALVKQGLFGYNSVLTGLALPIFLAGNAKWFIGLAGAALAAIFTAAVMHFLKSSRMPALTFPYIVLTWLLLLASYHLEIFKLAPGNGPQDLFIWKLKITGAINLINGLLYGTGQVYFISTFWAGILLLIALFWAGWKPGVYAVLGTAIGWITAFSLGAEVNLLNLGLYGFNAVLTILAVAQVFEADSPFAPITGVIAAVLSVPITASVDILVSVYGLPGLTMPFVLVTWFFIAARRVMPKL